MSVKFSIFDQCIDLEWTSTPFSSLYYRNTGPLLFFSGLLMIRDFGFKTGEETTYKLS